MPVLTKRIIAFISVSLFLYLMGAFVSWDITWYKDLAALGGDQRLFIWVFYWFIILSAMDPV